MLTGLISQSLIFQEEKEIQKTDKLGVDEAVVILNPTKYTLQAEDVDDTSEADEIEEEQSSFMAPSNTGKKNNQQINSSSAEVNNQEVPFQSDKLRHNIKIAFRDHRQKKRMDKLGSNEVQI